MKKESTLDDKAKNFGRNEQDSSSSSSSSDLHFYHHDGKKNKEIASILESQEGVDLIMTWPQFCIEFIQACDALGLCTAATPTLLGDKERNTASGNNKKNEDGRFKWEKTALIALQHATEAFIIDFFLECGENMRHAGREKLSIKDVERTKKSAAFVPPLYMKQEQRAIIEKKRLEKRYEKITRSS